MDVWFVLVSRVEGCGCRVGSGCRLVSVVVFLVFFVVWFMVGGVRLYLSLVFMFVKFFEFLRNEKRLCVM